MRLAFTLMAALSVQPAFSAPSLDWYKDNNYIFWYRALDIGKVYISDQSIAIVDVESYPDARDIPFFDIPSGPAYFSIAGEPQTLSTGAAFLTFSDHPISCAEQIGTIPGTANAIAFLSRTDLQSWNAMLDRYDSQGSSFAAEHPDAVEFGGGNGLFFALQDGSTVPIAKKLYSWQSNGVLESWPIYEMRDADADTVAIAIILSAGGSIDTSLCADG